MKDDLSILSVRQKRLLSGMVLFTALYFLAVGLFIGTMSAHESSNYFDEDEKYEFRTFWVEYGYSEGYADGLAANEYNASRLSTPTHGD